MARASALGTTAVLGAGLLLSGSAVSAPAQYGVSAELKSTGTMRSADARLSVHGVMTAKHLTPSGAGITLKSSIEMPFGCASDTIFENGFDP
jgi:hypothetical protein